MEEKYEVFCGGLPVGKAEVTKQGLYYKVICRCKADGEEVHRLTVRWKDGWENLGVPVPDRDGLFLSKRVAAKRIGQGPYDFVLMPLSLDPELFLFPKTGQSGQEDRKHDLKETYPDDPEDSGAAEAIQNGQDMNRKEPDISSESVPVPADMEEISEDKAFSRLEDLENARLAIINGQPMAAFSEKDPSDIQPEANGTMVGA